MSESKIEWTDRSDWNPVRGCTRVSPGCGGPGDHGGCYAEGMAARFSLSAAEVEAKWRADPKNAGNTPPIFKDQWGHGFAEMQGGKPRWTGKVELQKDRLLIPFKWRGPLRVFPNSTSDFFHEALGDWEIDRLFAVMALCRHLEFQVLTKRAERMRDYMCTPDRKRIIAEQVMTISDMLAHQARSYTARPKLDDFSASFAGSGPFRNIWLGISAEDQERWDERKEHLRNTPAAVRFASFEPLLGPIVEARPLSDYIQWAIVGGESGPKARPMHPQWAYDIRDQCAAAGVAFFFKQWGEWEETPEIIEGDINSAFRSGKLKLVHREHHAPSEFQDRCCWPGDTFMQRVGKKAAGRLLDGVEWNQFPIRARSAGSLPLTIAGNEPGGRAGAVSFERSE